MRRRSVGHPIVQQILMIADRTGMQASTCARGLGPVPDQPADPHRPGHRRAHPSLEHERPVDPIHVDVKKLGKIPDGGGWRYLGRQQGRRNRAATPGKARSQYSNPLIVTCYLHTLIEDPSRVAYVEAHDDETKETAAVLVPGGRLVRRA